MLGRAIAVAIFSGFALFASLHQFDVPGGKVLVDVAQAVSTDLIDFVLRRLFLALNASPLLYGLLLLFCRYGFCCSLQYQLQVSLNLHWIVNRARGICGVVQDHGVVL